MNIKTKIATTYSKLCTFAILALCASSVRAQVAVAPLQLVRQQFLSSTGVPLANGCLTFNATGTSTPQAIYTDSTGTFQAPNPYQLDSAGESNIWLSNTGYDLTAYAGVNNTLCSVSLGAQLWQQKNINPFAIINSGSNYIVAVGTVDPSSPVPGELAYRSDIPCFRGYTSLFDCFAELTLTQTFTNKTITLDTNTLNCTSNVAGQYARNNGTKLACSAIQPQDITISIPNNVSGTLLNSLAKITGTTVTFTGITDTGGAIGIVISGNGTVGNATIQTSGLVNCIFDGATTAGDYVQISTTVTGACKDVGASYPSVNQIIGRVLSTNGGAGTYQIYLFGPEDRPVSTITVAPPINTTGLSANVSSTPILTPAANGFYRASCYLVVTQAATTSSTLPQCQILYTDADSSIAETESITFTNTANTLGATSFIGSTTITPYFYAKNGVSISYQTAGYASTGATPMQYALHLRLEGPF